MNLLVVTEFPPNASGGGPAVVRQMLKDWPVEKVYWWSCFRDPDRRFGQRVADHRWAAIPPKLYPARKWPRLRSALLQHLWTPWAGRHLCKTIEQFKPDLLWVIPHNWSIGPLHAALAGCRLPYHVSIHDYVDVHDNPRRFGKKRCTELAQMADDIFTRATTADAISQEMADDLRGRTGKCAEAIIRYGVEPRELDEIGVASACGVETEIRIAYAGSILVEKEFALFVEALRMAQRTIAKPIRLHLFGANPFTQSSWFDSSWMITRGNLAEAELRNEMRRCHWGFSPMALTDHDPRYNRFSFPTKFIAYLAAGLPVITLGHPESSVVRMANRNAVGLNTSADDSGELAAQLKATLGICSPREQFSKEIIRCARCEFDASRMRRMLYACFQKCATDR